MATSPIPSKLCKAVRGKRRLRRAWKHVYTNGMRPNKSREVQRKLRNFESEEDLRLEQLYRKLLQNQFRFAPAKGFLQPRKNKPGRPLVSAPVESRIVQRALLDVLQGQKQLREYLESPHSFGGLPKRNVREAIAFAYSKIEDGYTHYIRTDIPDFFCSIPKELVLGQLARKLDDPVFVDFIRSALDLELEDMDKLGKLAERFPIHEIGVAQGCCLSPLIGNILLHEFDKAMNTDDVTCIRYIDDILLLSTSQKRIDNTFAKGVRILKKLGLSVYLPANNPEKASAGQTHKPFGFLGCDVRRGMIQPNRKSRASLLKKISAIVRDFQIASGDLADVVEKKRSLAETVREIGNIARGWGNQYSFCNCPALFLEMDLRINTQLDRLISFYQAALKRHGGPDNYRARRKLIGMHLLEESNSRPIIS